MTITFKKTVVAAALLVSFNAAMASDEQPIDPVGNSTLFNLTMNAERDDRSTSRMEWVGSGTLSAEGTAAASSSQATSSNLSANADNSPNTARIGSDAANGADGNIGINVTAGAGNLQGNAASIVSNDSSDVFASASTHATQSTLTNFSFNLSRSPNEAVMDAALANASGNIGVNISAGAGNAQSNQLAMIESARTNLSRASATIEQRSSGNASDNQGGIAPLSFGDNGGRSEYRSADSANSAIIKAGALAYATGNIGVSVAAGVGNAQANALAVSVVSPIRR